MTAKENGSVEALWRLRSSVITETPLRCCWMMIKPVRIPGQADRVLIPVRVCPHFAVTGPSTLLQQNGLYGGTFAEAQPNSSGFFVASFLMQLYASDEEELNVHEGQTETYCVVRKCEVSEISMADGVQWRLKPYSREAFFWAGRFLSRGKIWSTVACDGFPRKGSAVQGSLSVQRRWSRAYEARSHGSVQHRMPVARE